MPQTIPMEALGYQNYNGNWYTCGQEIPVTSEADVNDMIALRLARRKPSPAPAEQDQTPPPFVRREMVPETTLGRKKDKKKYDHREMRVDES